MRREPLPVDELMIEPIARQPDALHHRLDTDAEAGQPTLEWVMGPEAVVSGPVTSSLMPRIGNSSACDLP